MQYFVVFKSVIHWYLRLYAKCSNQEVNIALHHYEYKLFVLLQATYMVVQLKDKDTESWRQIRLS